MEGVGVGVGVLLTRAQLGIFLLFYSAKGALFGRRARIQIIIKYMTMLCDLYTPAASSSTLLSMHPRLSWHFALKLGQQQLHYCQFKCICTRG